MNKILLTTLCVLLSATAGNAQDKIFKSDGSVITAKIKGISVDNVVFNRYDNPTGPEYTLSKNEVDKIRYENGEEEWLRKDKERKNARWRNIDTIKLRPNIIAFAPIQFSENGVVGFSVSYERAIDKEDIVSFYVPAMLVINNSQQDYYGVNTTNNDPMFYLMPGLKIYPTGAYGKVKYAIGPSLVVANGQKTDYSYNNYGTYSGVVRNHFLLGMMINQSVNINVTPHLCIGSEFGMGFTYINSLAGLSQPTEFLMQFSFKIGYRF